MPADDNKNGNGKKADAPADKAPEAVKVPGLDPNDPAIKALVDAQVAEALKAHGVVVDEKIAAIKEAHADNLEDVKAGIGDEVARRVAEALSRRPPGDPATYRPDDNVIRAMAHARAEPKQAMNVRLNDERMVLMTFPTDVLVTLADHSRVQFRKGTQGVPESLVDHPYLKQCKVTLYDEPRPTATAEKKA